MREGERAWEKAREGERRWEEAAEGAHLAARNREEDGAAPAVARALEVVERERRLEHIGRLDEDELVVHDLLEHAHVVPLAHDLLQARVRREE